MILTAFGDTHGHHRDLTLPPGDVLICSGDFMRTGNDLAEIIDFNNWLGEQPHAYKLVVPGNHDLAFEGTSASLARSLLTNATYLENSGTEIGGCLFWGSPQTPAFNNWAFNAERGSEIRRYWNMIPNATDVLITHGPPRMILDRIVGNPDHLGCTDLLERLNIVQPSVHIFGHIHSSYGFYHSGHMRFYNVAVVNEYREDTPLRVVNPATEIKLTGGPKWQ